MDRFERLAGKVAADGGARDGYAVLLEYVAKKGVPVLTAQDVHKDIPTIHGFAGKYRSSVQHMGFGCFVGKTEHGEFTFDGGGAMNHDGGISWTVLTVDDEHVLRDLGYDMRKVQRALEELLEARTAAFGDPEETDRMLNIGMMSMAANRASLSKALERETGEALDLKALPGGGQRYLEMAQSFKGGFGVMNAVLDGVTLVVRMAVDKPLSDGSYAGFAKLEWEHKRGGSNGHTFAAVWWMPSLEKWVVEAR